jgi:pyruvate/2-oxoglutarate/acetoin dehydrogenase E1 component/TPP-dependent pyruvate/acetoin dehydrogenase alpha subunit
MLENSIANDTTDAMDITPIEFNKEAVLKDFRICCISREASLLARKEVLTGKAKFGIIGDGKEVPQVAMAKFFQKGDFRSGYYRDQTFMFALGLSTVQQFFAQLYADAENDPFSGGRQMNNHFATPLVQPDGNWTNHKDSLNVSSDISCTGGQMARALGLAFASKKYRESNELKEGTPFSINGNEVCFCTIGDASTSEGVFWETVNAAGVLQVPLSISVWDDGYGISVPKKYQTTKESISKALQGMDANEEEQGIKIFKVKGWDYVGLMETYREAIQLSRTEHVPTLIHVTEVTQPQGHSTSGSHERYKTKERLKWEKQYDCILKMEEWIKSEGLATAEELKVIRKEAKSSVKKAKEAAWKAYNDPTLKKLQNLKNIYSQLPDDQELNTIKKELDRLLNPLISDITKNARKMYFNLVGVDHPAKNALKEWLDEVNETSERRYHTNLYSNTPKSALNVPVIRPEFEHPDGKVIRKNGYEILNSFFDVALERDPAVFAFGEDVGKIGDVNQGFAGLQKRYGINRIFDTGIREWTIMGQAIGMAMRGMRPIAEIQYLDYLIYGLEPLTDDVATLRYRSNGIQAVPMIVRTRGHRLEGIWHAGSPMGMIINALRGMYVLTPRNMTQAAGFYNTMLQSDDPALIIECLNGYRLKEELPSNIGEYTVPLGVPEVLHEGTDVTLVTYGTCVRVAEAGMKLLEKAGISVELIDVQTLLPFDLEHQIVESLKKTNRVVFMDEDVPGGATAYMMREVLEKQGGYQYLDSAPTTITAKAHRPPYGSDGDYFSKPNPEDVFEVIYKMVYEATPWRFKGKL